MWWIATGIIIIIVLGFYLIRHRPKKRPKYPYKPRNGSASIDLFMGFLNPYRNENGAGCIGVDDHASGLAFDHVTYMMANQEVSHAFLDERRSDLALKGATEINEIVNGEFSTIESAFKGFKNSPSHNRAMLDKKVDTCGVSVRQDKDGKYYVAVMFFKR